MRKRSFVMLCAVTAVIAGSASAQFITPWRVNPLSGKGNFEVIEGPGAGNQRYWCEAARYVKRTYRVSGSTRMYILTPEGRAQTLGNAYGVGYTIAPSAELLETAKSAGGYSVSISNVGYNLTVSHASSFCSANVLF